jgi:hypothetical protein
MFERVKAIELTNNDTGKVYTLDFNRDVVRRAERAGFSLSECEKYPSLLADLWYYSFLMHHEREISRKRTDAMLDDLGGIANAPEGLFERLGELYTQTYGVLDSEKNGQLTVAF